MEEALKESEERYRTLVEQSFDGVFIYNGPSIIFANRRLHEMFGYVQGELEGTDHLLLCHPDHRKFVRERAFARLQGGEAPSRYEIMFQRKDGSSFEGEINAKLVNIRGEAAGTSVVKGFVKTETFGEGPKTFGHSRGTSGRSNSHHRRPGKHRVTLTLPSLASRVTLRKK